MSKREWLAEVSSSSSSRSFSATVVANHLPGQNFPELFNVHLCTGVSNTIQNEGIGDGYIEQEVCYVFIELPALHPDVVIPSQLVSSVHTSHVFVVGDHSCRAVKGLPCAILCPSQDCAMHVGVTSCVHAHHSLPVPPGRSTHIAGLNSAHFTPKNVHVNIVGMYNYVRCCGM